MRVTWFTESPRFWRSLVAGFFVLLVLLLGISAPPVMWIDATGKSRATAERNRSDPKGLSLLGLAADRQRSATGEEARLPYGVRRRST
jgi:hypothetical protein